MSIAIVHLSDIHYRRNWYENHGVVFRAFFDDLRSQLDLLNSREVYLVLSGDVVKAGHDSEAYSEFLEKFDVELTSVGISKSHRICVPGNHDVSTTQIESKKVDHEGPIFQNLGENLFNDYAESPSDVFKSKFEGYRNFESIFSDYQTMKSSVTGSGWDLTANVGIYCLNTAFFSSGGLKNLNGDTIKDEKRLGINTRNLHYWTSNSKARCKILVMHHPLNWLTEWAQQEISTLLNKDFALCLSGHAHNQKVFHSIRDDRSLVEVSAPPLFTDKKDELGYSIISISAMSEVSCIAYRQWTKHHSFRPGVNFSNTEDGKVIITQINQLGKSTNRYERLHRDVVEDNLTKQLNESLTAFSSQPEIWIEPTLSTCSEVDSKSGSASKVTVADLIGNPRSIIIKAPPQFGLTCLAHHLAREAWRHTPGSLWLTLDSRALTSSASTINRATKHQLKLLGCEFEDVKCLILDSWKVDGNNSYKILKSVHKIFEELPIIVMQTDVGGFDINMINSEDIGREFVPLHLWSLSREHVRSVVVSYNDQRHIGDEDMVTSKVVSDIDALNMHRTPLNCLTVLKASEVDFDESPVNRTDMLQRVLFLLFDAGELPTYKVKPDMKDCSYVLGYFCEWMIRNDKFFFSREQFIDKLSGFCKERIMALDVNTVFDILYANHILVNFDGSFCFRFTFWLHFFTAQRMHHEQNFAQFIFKDAYYTRFPEVIEFYTGIDRRRDDALEVLINDLKRGCENVQDKCGLPDEFDPYKFIQWKPSPEMLAQMEKEVRDGVSISNLPAQIKDRYADRSYDKSRPYDQEVRTVLAGDSLLSLMMSMHAAAKALRNSDFAAPGVKRLLLIEILKGFKQLTKILLVLIPLLSEKGQASFDGMRFLLDNSFSDIPEQRLREILMTIPYNVITWYKDDLFSQKMGPLLIEQYVNENDDIIKHELVLLIIAQRPHGWRKIIEKYIEAMHKNSFYLLDTASRLRSQYAYSYATPNELKNIEYLIKMSAVKHDLGTKNPGIKAIQKVSDSVLPERIVG